MCRTAHAIPALVSLRNHGQEIIFASVFHSFRSQHSYSQASLHNANCMHVSRHARCSKELALGIEGRVCGLVYSGYDLL